MAQQIEHLIRLSRLDHVSIGVLPFGAGAHAALTGAFTILDFDDPDDPAVVYLESQIGAQYLEKETELDEYRRVFDLIAKQSIPIEEFQ